MLTFKKGNSFALIPIQQAILVAGRGWRAFASGRVQGRIDLYAAGVYRLVTR